MSKRTKIYVFSASLLLLAVATLLCVFMLKSGKKPDKNGMYKNDAMWFEVQKQISTEAAKRFGEKINSIQQKFLTPENKTYYSIVPDKSFYNQDSGYPIPDYASALTVVNDTINSAKYIDITNALNLSDYYITDPHWRQEKLSGVLSALGNEMDFKIYLNNFQQKSFDSFKGSYSKNLPDNTPPETLFWLTSDSIENAICNVFTTKDFEEMTVYREDKLAGKTPYDIFLYGATPLVKIENPAAKSDRELVIFRDSYASSLAPLLIEHYKTITLIDLRYMASQILPDYVTFTNQDVLFLYSTGIIADSAILR